MSHCLMRMEFHPSSPPPPSQLSKAFEYPSFSAFDRVRFPAVRFAGMMQYDGDLQLPAKYLVAPPVIEKTSGQYLVKNGVRTFACR